MVEILIITHTGALVVGALTGRHWYRWRLHKALRGAALTQPPAVPPIDHDAILGVLKQRGPGQP